jgi:heme-degrading monooxygenase HmoA
MIARLWRGAVRSDDRTAYLDYLQATGLEAYRNTPGNRGVFALCREVDGLAEFLLVSLWDDRDAIRRFAGAEMDRAVFYPDDDRFLVNRDLHVTHFEVLWPEEPPSTVHRSPP